MKDLMKTIQGRRSVRTFDGIPVSEEDRDRLERYMRQIKNPFGIPVRFVLLDAKKYGLSSPVLSGEKLYVAGKVEKVPYADVAFGYSFEKLVLYAWSLGIGTTWIGGTMKRELFERAAGLSQGEMMPCVTPLGYPAKKRSIRETVMRKGVGADTRMPAGKVFFDGAWDHGLPADKQAAIADLIEMVRWAPSAVNKQPWRIVVSGSGFHFYEKRDKGYVSEKTGDLQKVDVGIALCHFMMGMEEHGDKPGLAIDNPGLDVPENVEYIATVRKP
jgi:nitroreductase